MNQILIFIFGVIVGGVVISLIRQNKRMVNPQEVEKLKNKEKILAMLEADDQLTNDEIQKALGVSDATATRYLDELQKEEKIGQVGNTGHRVYYIKK